MVWELVVIAVIALFIADYRKVINTNKFIKDTRPYLNFLKEEDYEFLLTVKYGNGIDVKETFEKRLNNALLITTLILVIFLGSFSIVNVVGAIALGFFAFKNEYWSLSKYYKRHLHEVDSMLPYYLKSLEILAQHYTIPVALNKSIEDAPEIFKPGLERMIKKINQGDSSIQPYTDFAIEYPVRDSMRMMRLLYRLGLGNQENKIEQLLVFSKNVSSLQNKAREVKYKIRIDKFESKTFVMLGVTGGAVMIMLLVSVMQSFSSM